MSDSEGGSEQQDNKVIAAIAPGNPGKDVLKELSKKVRTPPGTSPTLEFQGDQAIERTIIRAKHTQEDNTTEPPPPTPFPQQENSGETIPPENQHGVVGALGKGMLPPEGVRNIGLRLTKVTKSGTPVWIRDQAPKAKPSTLSPNSDPGGTK